VRYLHAVSPPEIEISALSLEEALLAAKRMNRMLATPAYVVGWILGILKCWPSDKNAVDGCDQVLRYLVQEFPGPMYPLTLNLSSGDFSSEAWRVLSHYREQLSQDYQVLQALPWLQEFALLPREAEVLRVLRQRTSDEIVRHAKAQSIFAKFAKQINFKYAHRVVVPAAGGETSLQMQEIAGEAPMPQSEWSDPLEGIRLRNDLWQGGRE